MAYSITESCTGCGHCAMWCPTRAITGRRKAGYTITADRCIECGACGRICTFAAVKSPDGRSAIRLPLSQWFRPVFDADLCNRCNKCVEVCPVHCLQFPLVGDADGGLAAGSPQMTRPKLCIGCGFCLKACETNAVHSAQPVQ